MVIFLNGAMGPVTPAPSAGTKFSAGLVRREPLGYPACQTLPVVHGKIA